MFWDLFTEYICSIWENFHDSLVKVKRLLERNQYPPDFYKPIIKDTLNKIINEKQDQERIVQIRKHLKSTLYVDTIQGKEHGGIRSYVA